MKAISCQNYLAVQLDSYRSKSENSTQPDVAAEHTFHVMYKLHAEEMGCCVDSFHQKTKYGGQQGVAEQLHLLFNRAVSEWHSSEHSGVDLTFDAGHSPS